MPVKTGYDVALHLTNYHFLDCQDLRIGVFGVGDVRKYISGTALKGAGGEQSAILGWIGRNNKVAAVPPVFNILNDPRVDGDEPFYRETLARAFAGRASPAEYRDTVRLAFLAGRIKYPVDAPAYATLWFGQDCNAFVGNFLGLSPNISIAAYATGYGKSGKIPGAGTDIYAVRDFLPLPPVATVRDIRGGNVLVSYCATRDDPWAHIALVSSFTLDPDGLGGTIMICEWGAPGGPDNHMSGPHRVKLITNWKCPHMAGKPILCFEGKGDPQNHIPPSKRIFFDHATCDRFTTRGWNVGNREGI